MEKQEQFIEEDCDDLQILQAQIKKVQKLKNNYLQQLKQISSLQNKVSELKSQNQTLKTKHIAINVKQSSEKQQNISLNDKNQLPTHASEFYSGDPQSNCQNSHSAKNGLVNANATYYKTNRRQNIQNRQLTQQRFYNPRMFSPQPYHYQNSNRNNLNCTSRQKNVGNFYSQKLQINNDKTMIMKTRDTREIFVQENLHRQVRNNLINSFVQDLQTEIQEKSVQLKKERISNINAQRQIQFLKQEMQRLRYETVRQEQVYKENIMLKQQLQNEISDKIGLKQQISCIKKELLFQKQRNYRRLSQYDNTNLSYGQFFDEQLNRMDQVYARISRGLKQ